MSFVVGSGRLMTALGQTRKCSRRANDVRFAPNSGLNSDLVGGPFGANNGLVQRSKFSEFLARLCSAINAAVDFNAQRSEVDRLGHKRLGATLKRATLVSASP